MARLHIVDPHDATGKAKTLLDTVKEKLGIVPNIARGMVNSPAVLEGYLGLSGALAGGTLPAKLRERIALAVAEANRCQYCLAAHNALGKAAGLSAEEVVQSRRAESTDAKTEAALRFVRDLAVNRGDVSDEAVASVREAGFDDGEIAELVANVALNVFTNYFNHVADTPIDFPEVEALP